MLTEKILDKLDKFYDDVLKKRHGSCREITWGILISTLIKEPSKAGYKAFPDIGEQTFNRMMFKAFPDVTLNGGGETWGRYLLLLIEHKHCSKCNKILPLSSYHKDKSTNLGISSVCALCKNSYQKGSYTKYNDAHKRSHNKNRGKIRSRNILYKIQRSLRIPSWSESSEIAEFYANCPPGFHVDHILPLCGRLVSGLHVLSNLQYLTAEENLQKSNKFEIE